MSLIVTPNEISDHEEQNHMELGKLMALATNTVTDIKDNPRLIMAGVCFFKYMSRYELTHKRYILIRLHCLISNNTSDATTGCSRTWM